MYLTTSLTTGEKYATAKPILSVSQKQFGKHHRLLKEEYVKRKRLKEKALKGI